MDGGGYVLGAESAGDDDVELRGKVCEDGAGFRPWERDAGPAEGLPDFGIDEDVMDGRMGGQLLELVADGLGTGASGFDDPVESLNELDAAVESLVELSCESEIDPAVKLGGGEVGLVDDGGDVVTRPSGRVWVVTRPARS